MRKLVRFITREAPLVAVEAWYEGIVRKTGEYFQTHFPENILVFRRGTVESYRDAERLFKEVPPELSRWAKEHDPIEACRIQYKALQDIRKVKGSPLEKIKKLRVLLSKGFPGLIVSYLFPYWQEREKLFDPGLINEAGKWRKKTDPFFDTAIEAIYSELAVIAEKKGWDIVLLKFITFDELEKAIKANRLPLQKLRKRGQSEFGYMDGKIIFNIDKELAFRGFELAKEAVKGDIKGSIANKGRAKGRAKLVFSREDLSKVEPGDVLVAPMTTPWYLPAMHKAAAIITDEGGITCHAAIVSRELNIPCIIGTGTATHALKDGDMVEVDADKGMVRKIDKLGKRETKSTKGEKWLAVAHDFGSYLFRNKIWEECIFLYEKELKLPIPLWGIKSERGKIAYFQKPSTWEKAHIEFTNRLNKDITLLRRIIDKTNKLGEEMNKYTELIFKSKLGNKSPDELIGYINRFSEMQTRVYSYGTLLPLLDFIKFSFIETNLKGFLKSQTQKAEEYFQILTIPSEESFAAKQEKDLLRLEKKYFNNKPLRKLIADNIEEDGTVLVRQKFPAFYQDLKKHTENHCWVYYAYAGPAFKESDFLGFIKSHQGINPGKKLKDVAEEKKQLIARKEKIIKELKPDKFNREIMKLAGTVVWAKPRRKDYQSKSYYHMVESVLMEIAKRLGLTREQVLSAPIPDLERGLKTGRIDKKKLDSIYKLHIVYPKDNQVALLHGREAKKFPLAEKEEKVKKAHSLKGSTACRGHAIGAVKIINSVEDLSRMNEGDILVSMATTPSIVSAMKKAAAIVTDEGGITCHAAIVSREMNIPCIVGTEHATRVFKDGDVVEVDAEKGIVRKVEGKGYKAAKKIKRPMKKKMVKRGKPQEYTPENILWFKDLDKRDIPIVGGKGANLGEMFSHFPIPDGFCVTVTGYRKFMEETGIIGHVHGLLDKVDVEDTEQLDKISKEIRQLILKQKFPKDLEKDIVGNYSKLKHKKVAVRSSATAEDLPTASFAGQQDTYLNVTGQKNVIESVQKCWASLFTSRAIYYREKNNFKHRDVLISVVIQGMVDAKYAGVMFTVDPVNKKFILIEVVEGLGEALVSGQVTPNTYFIHKRDEKVMEKDERFPFDMKLLHEIAKAGKKIHKHYKYPMDVEFALDKSGKLYILQARPITTL